MTVIKRRPRRLNVYTDGACSGGRGAGGWAWATDDRVIMLSGRDSNTTNQRMEMYAAYSAIRTLGRLGYKVTVHSDSAYVVNCFEQKWYLGWTSDGRKKKTGDKVANFDLWMDLIDAVRDYDAFFKKVKGHSGDPMNDFVDMLAVNAKRGTLVP